MSAAMRDPNRTVGHGGFTLVELLVVITVIGVLSALAIPNLINALHRGKQKATMADLHSIAEAIEVYSLDNGAYPSVTTAAQLESVLEPVYIREVPSYDGWRNRWMVTTAAAGYTVASGGRDGGTINWIGGPTNSFDDAIVFSDGKFTQWPEGFQN